MVSNKVDELKTSISSGSPLAIILQESFLPEDEIVKNIVKKRNPSISDTDSDVMVKDIPKDVSGKESFKSVPSSQKIYSNDNKIRSSVDTGKLPINKDSGLFDEARDMKSKTLVSVIMISNIQTSLLQEIIRVAIQLGTSISGISIMVAPMSFNVPGAISHLLLIVDQLSNICKSIVSTLPFLDNLSLLDFVIDNVPTNPVVTGLETALTFISGIYKICSVLKSFIDKLFSSLNKSLSGGCEKEKRKYNRKKRKLVKELRDILNDDRFGGDPYNINSSESDPFYFPALEDKIKRMIASGEISEDDADSARDIQDEIKSFDDRIKIACDFKIPVSENGVVDIDTLSLNNEVFDVIKDIKKVTDSIQSGKEKYVYDVKLPDGTILSDLDIESVNELKEKFDIIFKTDDNINQ